MESPDRRTPLPGLFQTSTQQKRASQGGSLSEFTVSQAAIAIVRTGTAPGASLRTAAETAGVESAVTGVEAGTALRPRLPARI